MLNKTLADRQFPHQPSRQFGSSTASVLVMTDYGTGQSTIGPHNPSSSGILRDAGQLLTERLRHPVGLDSEFRQDDLRRIVARQACDVTTRMAARAAQV
jgi:hypothetical protein